MRNFVLLNNSNELASCKRINQFGILQTSVKIKKKIWKRAYRRSSAKVQHRMYILKKIKQYINSFESIFEIPLEKLIFFRCFVVYGFSSSCSSSPSQPHSSPSQLTGFQSAVSTWYFVMEDPVLEACSSHFSTLVDSLFLFSAGKSFSFLSYCLICSFVYNIFFFSEPFWGVFITSST